MKRQLAAVLAADVCGYSRLMGEDSEAMLRALRRLRAEVFGPSIASHHGRIVKSMGDGWIVLFSSAAAAVSGAMRVQDSLMEGAQPDEPEIRMRMGVHLGDVVEEEDDVFGDGVNIAARLEQASSPGSITVSEAVYGSLDGTLRPSFDHADALNLKNIDRPVQIWVRGEIPRSSIASRNTSDGLKLAIAPVATADNRHEVRELAHAITGDLTTYLDATMWISATVSQSPDEAKYVLQPSLRSSGDRLRLDVQLTGADDEILLKTKFDGTLGDIFDWQDAVSEDLSGQVYQTIFDAEMARLTNTPLPELGPSDHALQAAMSMEFLDPESLDKALSHAAAALEVEPDRPDALMMFFLAFHSSNSVGFSALCDRYREHAETWAETAKNSVQEDPRFEFCRLAVSRLAGTIDVNEQHRILEKLLRTTSRDYVLLAFYGWTYVFIGMPEQALDCLRSALKLGRHTPWRLVILGGLAQAYVQTGQFKKAIQLCDEGLVLTTRYTSLYRVKAAAYAQLGELENAQEAIAEVLNQIPEDTITEVRARNRYPDNAATRLYFDGLRIAGLPE